MTSAAVAAERIVRAIERRQSRVLIGADARWMDRLCRLLPERAARILADTMDALLRIPPPGRTDLTPAGRRE